MFLKKDKAAEAARRRRERALANYAGDLAPTIDGRKVILEVNDVIRQYRQYDEVVTAVDRASLQVFADEFVHDLHGGVGHAGDGDAGGEAAGVIGLLVAGNLGQRRPLHVGEETRALENRVFGGSIWHCMKGSIPCLRRRKRMF